MIQTMLIEEGGGVNICEGGSISANGFGPGSSRSAGDPNRCDTGIVIHFLKQVEIRVKRRLLGDVRIHWLWENKQGRRG